MWNKTKFVDQATERSQYVEKALVPEEKAPTPVMHHVSVVFTYFNRKKYFNRNDVLSALTGNYNQRATNNNQKTMDKSRI